MTSDTFDMVLRELGDIAPRVVVLYHGGEPFLNPDLFSMIQQVKELGAPFVKTVTNGMLLQEAMLPELVASGLDGIEFSIDGVSREENDTIRRGSDYTRVSTTIKRLVSVKGEMGSSTPSVHIVNCQIPRRDDIAFEPDIPHFISEDFAGYEVRFKTCWSIRWPGMPTETDDYVLYAPIQDTLTHCSHPYEQVTIRHNGDVVPCCYDTTSMSVLGNIHATPIREVWNGPEYRRFRASILSGVPSALCGECNVLHPLSYLVKREEVSVR